MIRLLCAVAAIALVAPTAANAQRQNDRDHNNSAAPQQHQQPQQQKQRQKQQRQHQQQRQDRQNNNRTSSDRQQRPMQNARSTLEHGSTRSMIVEDVQSIVALSLDWDYNSQHLPDWPPADDLPSDPGEFVPISAWVQLSSLEHRCDPAAPVPVEPLLLERLWSARATCSSAGLCMGPLRARPASREQVHGPGCRRHLRRLLLIFDRERGEAIGLAAQRPKSLFYRRSIVHHRTSGEAAINLMRSRSRSIPALLAR